MEPRLQQIRQQIAHIESEIEVIEGRFKRILYGASGAILTLLFLNLIANLIS